MFTHSKLKQEEPFPKKKNRKDKKEKTLNMTEGALYITCIFMNRFRSNRLNFVLLNLYPEQWKQVCVPGGTLFVLLFLSITTTITITIAIVYLPTQHLRALEILLFTTNKL